MIKDASAVRVNIDSHASGILIHIATERLFSSLESSFIFEKKRFGDEAGHCDGGGHGGYAQRHYRNSRRLRHVELDVGVGEKHSRACKTVGGRGTSISMTIDRIHLFIGRQHETVPTEIEVTIGDLESGKPVHGEICGYTANQLRPYIAACEEHKVYTRVHGKDYKVVNLSDQGVFTLEKVV